MPPVCIENPIWACRATNRLSWCHDRAAPASPFKSKTRLEAENAVRRHQLIVLRRKLGGRIRPTKRGVPRGREDDPKSPVGDAVTFTRSPRTRG
jgi:hypothetical protein